MTLTLGVQAETRIMPSADQARTVRSRPRSNWCRRCEKASCTVGMPIDVPFTELNKRDGGAAQGPHFPGERQRAGRRRSARRRSIAAAGDRLLISLSVKAHETEKLVRLRRRRHRAYLGQAGARHAEPDFAADRYLARRRIGGAFGLLSAAARAAMPYLQKALADNARGRSQAVRRRRAQKITLMLAEFRQPAPGTRADAAIDELRLTGIAFDSHTLRITAEAAGSVKVAVSELPKM